MPSLYESQLDHSSIRLLRPVPQDYTAILPSPLSADNCLASLPHFALETYQIENAPQYTAMSYTWGPPEDGMLDYVDGDKRPIIINTLEFRILPNLWDALRSALTPNRPGSTSDMPCIFWIDAICIDQNSLTERKVQVSIMDVIYKRATTTLIWLGPFSQDAKSAWDIIHLIERIPTEEYLELRREAKGRALNQVESDPIMQRFGLPTCLGHAAWEPWAPIFKFFRRRWFHRIWTIQEVVLSNNPRVLCGHVEMAWEVVAKTVIFLDRITSISLLQNDHLRATEPSFDRVQRHWNFMRRVTITTMKAESSRLEDFAVSLAPLLTGSQTVGAAAVLLQESLTHRMAFSSDMRDRVYGLLGVAHHITDLLGIPRGDLSPEYDESVTAARVFETVMTGALMEAQSLTLLMHLNDCTARRLKGLPSWVIDFSSTLETGHPTGYIRPTFNAAMNHISSSDGGSQYQSQLTMIISDHKLHARGIVIARVSRNNVVEYQHNDSNPDFLLSWMQCLAEQKTSYSFTNESRVEAFWRTLLMDANPALGRPAEWPGIDSDEMFKSWLAISLYRWTQNNTSAAKVQEMQRYTGALASDDATGEMLLCGWDFGNKRSDEAFSSQTFGDAVFVLSFDSKAEKPEASLSSCQRFWFSTKHSLVSHDTTTNIPGSIHFLANQESQIFDSFQSRQEQFSSCVNRTLARRKFILSDQGHFGLGPKAAEEGDFVAIVQGCPWPLVIRKQGGVYVIVGSAYIHGIMDGEVVDERTSWQPMTFV